jgi:hypothetical protein
LNRSNVVMSFSRAHTRRCRLHALAVSRTRHDNFHA